VSAGDRVESACRSIERAAPLLFQIVHGESKPRPAQRAIGDGADSDP
jgi:hypothetical protein